MKLIPSSSSARLDAGKGGVVEGLVTAAADVVDETDAHVALAAAPVVPAATGRDEGEHRYCGEQHLPLFAHAPSVFVDHPARCAR